MNFAVVPWSHHFSKNEIFNLTSEHNFDNRLNPFVCLKNSLLNVGHSINTIDYYNGNYDNLDAILFFRIDYSVLYQAFKSGFKGKMIYFAWEPPVVSKEHSAEQLIEFLNIFDCVMTWNDDLVDDNKFYKINFPQWFEVNTEKYQTIDFSNKKLLTNISMDKSSTHVNELYSARKTVIDFFENNFSEDFDFYGMRWDKGIFKNYKGMCNDKLKVYSKYKYAICFENMKNSNGYITEKLFDCFKAGIVPIYMGAPNIASYIPENCIIKYERFSSVAEMYQYISAIKEIEYEEIRNNISSFLASENIEVFEECFLRNQLFKVVNKNNDESNKILRIDIFYRFLVYKEYFLQKVKNSIKKIIGRPVY